MKSRKPARKSLHHPRPNARADGGNRLAWLIAAVSLISLLLGAGLSVWLTDRNGPDAPMGYVSFDKLDVASNVGAMVISLDLEVPRDQMDSVKAQSKSLETTFKSVLAATPPESLYSREGKQLLAVRLKRAADEVLGDPDLVSSVYFGNFKIYSR